MQDSQEQRIVYQVVATRRGQAKEGEVRARIGHKPFHIGSGSSANLHLQDASLLPIHARLFITTAGQVMITNLGDKDSIMLDSEPLAAFACVQWKPGSFVRMGSYDLVLLTLILNAETGQLERVRPAVITQENERVGVETELPYIEEGQNSVEMEALVTSPDPDEGSTAILGPIAPPLPLDQTPVKRDVADMLENILTGMAKPPAEPPPESPADRSTSVPQPPIMPFVPQDDPTARFVKAGRPSSPQPMNTLPKDWQSTDKLSAQVATNPVNMVVGERVRVPVSIRNGYDQMLSLRISVTGIPAAWVIGPTEIITVDAGQISACDLLLQPHGPVSKDSFDLQIHLSDARASEIAVDLPLRLNFKRVPDLVGRLEPVEAAYPGQAQLTLQNHTQAPTDVFVAGHTSDPILTVLPAQTHVRLPAGQIVRVPVAFAVKERDWFRPAVYSYAVTAAHASRAPLDYTGTVHIKPRIPLIPAAIASALTLLIIILAAIALGGSRPDEGIPPADTAQPQNIEASPTKVEARSDTTATEESASSEPTASATSTRMITPTPAPTLAATPTRIPTETPVPPASPTPMLAFDDPRPEGCTTVIPEGWAPYTVRSGDGTYRLAIDRGITVADIAQVNCLANPGQLTVGQILLLPER